jgi:hypothetical protein
MNEPDKEDIAPSLLEEIRLARSQLHDVQETVKQAARGMTGVLVTGFIVTTTLLVALCIEWLRVF